MKKIVLTFLVSFLISIAYTQNSPTNSNIKGVESIRYVEGNSYPRYLRLDAMHTIRVGHFSEWLKANFNLPKGVSFELIRREKDPLGITHLRFQQLFKGVPVIGGVYLGHAQNGQIYSMNGVLLDVGEMNTTAVLSNAESVKKAIAYIPSEKYVWEDEPSEHSHGVYPTAELIIVPEGLDFRHRKLTLAYKVDVYSLEPLKRAWVYIDAQTGDVVAEENRICKTDIQGTATTGYSGQRNITADSHNGYFRLRETGRGNGIETYDLNNNYNYSSASDFIDDDNNWNNVNSNLDQYATDLHWGMERTYDYYFNTYGKNSFDGQGATIKGYLHYGYGYANAFWNGEVVTFGDGDGGSSGINTPAVSLEVVGHEITHGVTEFSAGLIYSSESGALNESFSDIFGATIDFENRTGAGANWKIGDEISSDGIGFRSMSNPNYFDHPDCYEGDFWESYNDVHVNSSVQNFWFYLLSDGGTGVNEFGTSYSLSGIGYSDAAKIAYRTLNYYLTPSSEYADAAYYSSLAAQDLFGGCSSELAQTIEAWHAVGLNPPVDSVLALNFSAKQYYCKQPAFVEFHNFSFGLDSIVWDFGDGQTSSEFSPIHVYNDVGAYSVQAIGYGCSGSSDTMLLVDYIFVDTASTFCDTTIMKLSGNEMITSCSGVILDPGGNDDFTTFISSTMTISPPGATQITLDFSEFDLGTGPNSLEIYDGADVMAQAIGFFSGNGLPLGGVVTSSQGVITLRFVSGGYSLGPGFVVSYFADNDGSEVVAGFDVSDFNPPLSAPVQFTTIDTVSATVQWLVDDTEAFLSKDLKYPFSSPGSHKVKQIIYNCQSSDTLEQVIQVQGKPDLVSYSPTSISATMFSGDEVTKEITIENGSANDLWYSFGTNGYHMNFDTSFVNTYTESGAASLFVLEDIGELDSLILDVTINGDFDADEEFASVFVDDSLIAVIQDDNVSNGLDIKVEYVITGSILITFLLDHQLVVRIQNSIEVDPGLGGSDTHDLKIKGVGVSSVKTVNDQGVVYGVGSNVEEVILSAVGLSGGIYHSKLNLATGDPDYANVLIPVTMNVIDAAKPVMLNAPLDFGGVFVGSSHSLALKIRNDGSIPFYVFDAVSDNNHFESQLTLSVLPGQTGELLVTYLPLVVGGETGVITLTTSTGELTFNVLGAGIEPPELQVNPDTVSLTLLTGEMDDVPVTISNVGSSDLYYQIQNPISLGLDTTAQRFFSLNGDSTIFSFVVNPFGMDTLYLEVTINGDYDDFDEFAKLYIDGEFVALMEGNVTNGTDIISSFEFSGEQLSDWTADGQIDVKIVNSFYVSPSYGNASHQVYLQADGLNWVAVDSQKDTLSVGSSKEWMLHFDATDLFGGIYYRDVSIYSNDPILPVANIQTWLHVIGQPILSVDTLVDFGKVFVGYSDTASLVVENTGTDTLFVSNIVLDLTAFDVSQGQLVIPPVSSQEITISFHPTQSQEYLGHIMIESNLPTQIIETKGIGMMPPAIDVIPDTLFAQLSSGEMETQQLLIQNNGEYDLIRAALVVGSRFERESMKTYSISGASTVHEFENLPDIDSLEVIVTLNGDYDNLSEYASLYIDNTLIGAIDDGDVNNGVDIVVSYVFAGAQLENWVLDGQITVELKNTPDVDLGLGGTDSHKVKIVSNGEVWLSSSQTDADTTSQGMIDTIPVYFDATGLNGGDYVSSIDIFCNDPVQSMVKVPVFLHVEGQPGISVSTSMLDFGEQFVNSNTAKDLYIQNSGSDTLFVNDIQSDNTSFVPNTTALTILPGETKTVLVSFLPTTDVSYSGQLTIKSNVTDEVISLMGLGVLHPVIAYSPDTLFAELKMGEDTVKPLVIKNLAGIDLQYHVPLVGWYESPQIKKFFYSAGATTSYTFKDINPLTPKMHLKLTINGDFDGTQEYAEVYIDGTYFAKIEDNNVTNGEDIVQEFILEGSDLTNWLADSQLKVSIVNSDQVNTGYGADWHVYQISYVTVDWLSVEEASGSISAGNTDTVPVRFSSGNLGVGDYFSSFLIESNDGQNPSIEVPVHLRVLDPDGWTSPFNSPKVQVYPNPVADVLTISTDENLSIKSIDLIDMLGRVMYSDSWGVQEHYREMKLTTFPGGKYFLL
ncbi:MAG TPA: choice-of-anchor D domain-containing protein, partial [Saprospiraceae bacterium]|nr:choice-of-anchor D domain-containing protein [Saprospiraceae bacterium]